MKATGIIRRIDDLGRIVIPKEIRRMAGLRENDPMEIFVEGRKVILEKYLPMGQYAEQAREYVRAFQNATQQYVFITDTDKVIASVNHNYHDSLLSDALKEAIRNKADAQNIPLESKEPSAAVEYAAIIRDGSRDSRGEGIGAVVLVQSAAPADEAIKLQMQIAADFLGRLSNLHNYPAP